MSTCGFEIWLFASWWVIVLIVVLLVLVCCWLEFVGLLF